MQQPPRDILLIPFRDFTKRAPQILATTKRDSDAHMASLQAENAKRREKKKSE